MGEGQQHCHWVTKQIKGNYQEILVRDLERLNRKRNTPPHLGTCCTAAIYEFQGPSGWGLEHPGLVEGVGGWKNIILKVPSDQPKPFCDFIIQLFFPALAQHNLQMLLPSRPGPPCIQTGPHSSKHCSFFPSTSPTELNLKLGLRFAFGF